jgi:hypothetical protein
MLTEGDVVAIRAFKKGGYSISRTARALGLNRKAVACCWGPAKNSTNLEDYFLWVPCTVCGLEFPHPKFLASFECPRCKNQLNWNDCWYK